MNYLILENNILNDSQNEDIKITDIDEIKNISQNLLDNIDETNETCQMSLLYLHDIKKLYSLSNIISTIGISKSLYAYIDADKSLSAILAIKLPSIENFSNITNELLLKHGIKYDHSLMHNDFTPYYVRVGDKWTKIDYSLEAKDWMKPLVRGQETDLVEIPANWYLDDLPPMMFIKKSPNSFGFISPRDIGQMWIDQFDWVYENMDYAIFAMTIHPDVSGRPQVLLMHQRIIEHINKHEGVRWVTLNEMADDFIKRCPRKK